jgi:hypothetical protein
MNYSQDVCDRFWNKVNNPGKIDECWEWLGGKQNTGYGIFYFNSILQLTHRYSYEYYNGIIKNKLFVLHKCDNPPCLNPNHLELGTQTDNMKDMSLKNRKAILRGSDASNSLLLDQDILDIFKKIDDGLYNNIEEICFDYHVQYHVIAAIFDRKSWMHMSKHLSNQKLLELKSKIINLHLTEQSVKQIKQCLLQKISIIDISNYFKISTSTVYKIKNNIHWKHVTI